MGKKLKYIGCDDCQASWSRCDDPRGVLTKDKKYKVEQYDVHTWHTRVKLMDIEGWFNSTCFSGVPNDVYNHVDLVDPHGAD